MRKKTYELLYHKIVFISIHLQNIFFFSTKLVLNCKVFPLKPIFKKISFLPQKRVAFLQSM